MEFPVQVSSQLRPYLQGFRKAAGYTQKQMAEHLDITQQRYARLEARPESVSLEQLLKVFQHLGVKMVLHSTDTAIPAQDHQNTDINPSSLSTQKDRW